MVGWSAVLHLLAGAALLFTWRGAEAPVRGPLIAYTVEIAPGVPGDAPGENLIPGRLDRDLLGGAAKRAREVAPPKAGPIPAPAPQAPVSTAPPPPPERRTAATAAAKKLPAPARAAPPPPTTPQPRRATPAPPKPKPQAPPTKDKPVPVAKKAAPTPAEPAAVPRASPAAVPSPPPAPVATAPTPPPPATSDAAVKAKPDAPPTGTPSSATGAAAESPSIPPTPPGATDAAASDAGPVDDQYAAAIGRVRQRVDGAGGGLGGTGDPRKPASVGGAGEGGGNQLVGADTLIYSRILTMRMRQGWLWVGNNSELAVTVRFSIAPEGDIRDIRVDRSSGDPAYDASVLKAIRQASPLPPPPAANLEFFADATMRFRAGDFAQ
jgi:TonB family protein